MCVSLMLLECLLGSVNDATVRLISGTELLVENIPHTGFQNTINLAGSNSYMLKATTRSQLESPGTSNVPS